MEPSTRHFESILFDFEGTLVDFQWKLAEAEGELRALLARFGFDLSAFEGDNYAMLRTRALRLAPTPSVAASLEPGFAEIYDRYDADALSRWSLQPFARELLAALRRRGVALGLVTNIGRAAIVPALAKLGLDGAFDVVLTRNEVVLAKPSGEGIGKALAALGVGQQDALFVGDSFSDLYAARDAGVPVVIVLGGESPGDEIRARGPDYAVASLRALADLLSVSLP